MNSQITFELPEQLTISGLEDFSAQLEDWATQSSDDEPIYGGDKVLSVDAAGLQCLAYAFIRQQELGRTAQIINPSQTLSDAIQLLNLSNIIQLAD